MSSDDWDDGLGGVMALEEQWLFFENSSTLVYLRLIAPRFVCSFARVTVQRTFRTLAYLELGNESLGSDDVEGGDSEDTLWVVNSGFLEHLGGDWDSGVDWVGDDSDKSLRGGLGDDGGQVTDDSGVGVEEIVTGHSWLAWDSGWDDDDVSVLDGGVKLFWPGVSSDLEK